MPASKSGTRGLAWLFRGLLDERHPGRGDGGGRRAGDPGGPPSETKTMLEPAREAGTTGGEEGLKDVGRLERNERWRRAQVKDAKQDMIAGQETAMAGFEAAEAKVEEGVTDIRGRLEQVSQQAGQMPEQVRSEFDWQAARLDSVLAAGRTELGAQRGEAIGNVMGGESLALQAATMGMQQQVNSQKARINSMVQSGQISPSQASMMKMQVGMQGAMQIAPAVGQTIHAFTQTQAQTATAFGGMFAQFETAAAQTTGGLGATAGTAYANSQRAASEINTQLSGLDAQITGQRSALYASNAASRAAAQNANDQVNMAMLDYLEPRTVLHSPAHFNNYNVLREIFVDAVKTDQGDRMIEIYQDNAAESEKMGILNFVMGLAQTGLPGMLLGG